MKQLNTICTSKTSLEVSAIQALDELGSEKSNRVSPSKNYCLGAWADADHALNKIYSKRIVSPKKQLLPSRPRTVCKITHIIPFIPFKREPPPTQQSTEFTPLPKTPTSFANFISSKEHLIAQDAAPVFKCNIQNRSLLIKKTPIPIHLLIRQKIRSKKSATRPKSKLLIDYLSNNVKPKGLKKYRYFEKCIKNTFQQQMRSKALSKIRHAKGKENFNSSMYYTREAQNTSCISFK